MSERGGYGVSGSGIGEGGLSRYVRISPTRGRPTKIAYLPCPSSDADADADADADLNIDRAVHDLAGNSNCFAIPMSSLSTATAVKKHQTNAPATHATLNRKGGGGIGGGGGMASGGGGHGSAGKSGGGGGIGGSKAQMKGGRMKRSRELGGGSQGDEFHYRTHLFFAPARPGYEVSEERCSGFSTLAPPVSPMTHDVDAPQPLVDRRPSLSLLRWNNYNDMDDAYNYNMTVTGSGSVIGAPRAAQATTKTIPFKFVSQSPAHPGYNFALEPSATRVTESPLNNEQNMTLSVPLPASSLGRTEPISLAALDRDCFIIPVHSVERFLPAGIPMPSPPVTASTAKANSPLSVLEVSDPKMCILVHLMSPLEPIDPMLESPLAHPLLKQRNVASELLNEVQQMNQAMGGMLLANMEKSSEFPFIAYYAINTTQTDPSTFYTGIRISSLSKFEPKNLKYTAAHTLDLYSEVAAICRPPLVLAPSEVGGFKKTQTPATGYIISVFKVFEGDDGERFEKNWLYWTGARMLYRYLPRTAGLRRIALHKSTSTKGDKMYLLVCECADLLKDITAAAFLIPALRARLCGYTGLYRPIQAF